MNLHDSLQADDGADPFYDNWVNSGDITPRSVLLLALLVEGGLLLAAHALGWLFGINPWGRAGVNGFADLQAVGLGIGGGLILAAAGVLLERLPGAALRRFREFVHGQVAPVFADCSLATLAAISLAAGVGEECFFRGFLQVSLSGIGPGMIGVFSAVVIAGVIFGGCHALTPMYFFLATVGGLLFGGLFVATDHILVPITAHALYDFLILLYLVRGDRASSSRPNAVGEQETAA